MKSLATKLLLSASVLTTAVSMAHAQDAETAEDETSVQETVVITGSRIQRDPNVGAPVPVQSIDAEAIVQSGEFSLVDVVNDIPALVNSTSSEQSIDSAFALGTNVLNLRGLGSARTLTLIDGRRSVAGVEGSAAVDVSSIPSALVERVEVLTGGASAVYGADAVTGVVNFILKDDFEGLEVSGFLGANEDLNGEQYSIDMLAGSNFDNGRGNITFGISASRDSGLTGSESDALLGGPASSGGEWANPDLRFQNGEITASGTPALARFYNFDNTGLFRYGLNIPSQEQFIADYTAEFGEAPTLNAAEQALFSRAANALARTVIDQPVFSITSGNGYIIPGNPYTFAGFNAINNIDLDGNGVDDCLDSFTGYNSSFSAASFGVVGGCWSVQPDGSLRPVQDGVVTGNFNGGGGDSVFDDSDDPLLAPEERFSFYLTADYELNANATVFGELSGTFSKVEESVNPTSFWDLLFGAPDNPFLPTELQDLAQSTGGIAITIDPTIFNPPNDSDERSIIRAVAGVEGDFGSNYSYEISGTVGEFKREANNPNRVINDRFFAAIDAVVDPNSGEIVCRSTLDPSALPPSTPFGIPVYDDSAIYSFTPGANSPCVPLNIWAGETGVTQEALDFITADDPQEDIIQQYVLSAILSGTSSDFFELPAGPVGFVVGAEYRKEQSKASFSDFRLGVLPEGSPFAGANISDVSSNSSLFFRPNIGFASTTAGDSNYDVSEVFAEVSVPVLADMPFAKELTVDGAVRYSDYSTVGNTLTWKLSGSYAPVDDIRFRATLSEAVRAPNIGELFAPQSGTTFRPSDPCSIQNITNAIDVNAELGAARQANCTTLLSAIGVDVNNGGSTYAFEDPLSAAFGGITGGNPDLTEETAETYTLGFVAQPSFLDGLTISVDYWSVEIDDAIRTVDSQDIVDGCYDSLSGPNNTFCSQFTRNTDPNSAQFGGLNFLQSLPVNFARFEAAGTDFAVSYDFEYGANDFNATVQGTKAEKLDLFRDPSDPTLVDPELGETGRPEWAVNLFLDWERGPFRLGWQTQYLSEQTEAGVEIDELDALFGEIGNAGDFYRHDIEWGYEFSEELSLYGGVNNVSDEQPFRTQVAYPVGPRGRFFFVGATYKLP
ncbi:MAG: TonB-dependent receptor domain-containing protein [Henriciella sp.]